jgi:hypothetical protein
MKPDYSRFHPDFPLLSPRSNAHLDRGQVLHPGGVGDGCGDGGWSGPAGGAFSRSLVRKMN